MTTILDHDVARDGTIVEIMIQGKLVAKRCEIRSIPVSKIIVDPNVQQPLREGKVRAILRKGYDPAYANTIVVSRRKNGTYVVLDGQHRTEAAKRSGYETIMAVVWSDLSIPDEADLFVNLNAKSNPSAISLFKNRVQAGEDIPQGIAAILTEFGWKVTDSRGYSGTFAAVAVAERIYRAKGAFRTERPGSQVFSRVIETITQAWGLDKDGSNVNTVAGLAVFLIRYWDRIDQKKLLDALRRITPMHLIAEANAIKKSASLSPDIAFGFVIHREYNKRTRTKLQPFAF